MSESGKIKELQQQIEDLQGEKEKYRLIAEFTNDFEYWMDPKGKFEYISPGCKNLTGHASESFFQNTELFNDIIHPEDREKFREYISGALDLTLLGENLTFRIITRSMLIKHCEITSKAVYDPKGKYLGQRGSIRDITRLSNTLNQVKEISEKQVWEEQAKNKFKFIAEQRDREITTSLIQMSQKNELLQHISQKLEVLEKGDSLPPNSIRELKSKIEKEINSGGMWEEFKLHFEKNHPGFFERLSSKYPRVTSKDLKLCAYLRLQLSTKEIAGLLNITTKSAEISRVRLRKKLGLIRKDDLSVFLTRV